MEMRNDECRMQNSSFRILHSAFSTIRNPLTPTQQQILERLPATPNELAQALYGRVTRYERRLIYVHIALLRRRLTCPEPGRRDGTARIISRRRKTRSDAEGSTCRVIYELES